MDVEAQAGFRRCNRRFSVGMVMVRLLLLSALRREAERRLVGTPLDTVREFTFSRRKKPDKSVQFSLDTRYCDFILCL